MQKKLYKYLLAATLSVAALAVQAQKTETGESPRKLYVENKMPGLQYALASTAKRSSGSKKTYQGASLRHEIEEGKMGMPVKKGGDATANNTPKRSTEKVSLPSDQPATEKKVQLPEPFTPTQEDPAQPSNETKQDKPAAAPAASK